MNGLLIPTSLKKEDKKNSKFLGMYSSFSFLFICKYVNIFTNKSKQIKIFSGFLLS